MRELMLSMGDDLQFYLFFGFLGVFLIAERLLPKRQPDTSQVKRWRTNAALIRFLALIVGFAITGCGGGGGGGGSGPQT